jgi:hypothetical protein
MAERSLYTFWMSETQRDGLRRVKEKEGITASEQIRRALDAWLTARLALRTPRSTPAVRDRRRRPGHAAPGGPTMTLSEYLTRKRAPLTRAQSKSIRALIQAGKSCDEIARQVGCVPIQVAAVKANMARGR